MPAFAVSPFRRAIAALLLALAAIAQAPAAAQIETIDPNAAIDADLASPAPPPAGELPPAPPPPAPQGAIDGDLAARPGFAEPHVAVAAQSAPAQSAPAPVGEAGTYQEDDLIGAAEGVFGKGARGLAEMIRDILKKQGEPNAYIVGREGGGAFVVGARYGSGTLYHKVEGQQPVYWRGPSLGIDAGANAGSTFVLVYNLYDTEDLFDTYGAGEGQAYLIGGFHVSYLRKGDVVLIPVRMGAGLRLGINVGYMKFSKKQKWLPF